MRTADLAIETAALVKRRGSFTLGPLDTGVPRGYVTGFVGVNGSGKTTTLRAFLGLVRPDGGRIAMPPMGQVGVAFDKPFLVPDWTVRQAASAYAPFRPGWDRAHVETLCERFGLRQDAKVKDLSRGESAKLMVALAMGNSPDLLILDEPTSGLDPAARTDLVDVLRDYMITEGHTLLFSTHITSDLEDFADFIVLIRGGQIRFSGRRDELRERYALVRGETRQLTPGAEKQLCGMHRFGARFEGLVETNGSAGFARDIEMTEPTLDQIVGLLGRTAPEKS